ncbi:MAG TPA: hypothetical protein VK595_00665 [Vicinamibacterales bacterium]|nr:hypothetical protein [Vicinamibacterales bacterium]
MIQTKPDRGPKLAELTALLARFAEAGLQPVLSTNGGIPEADIQVAKETGHSLILGVWLTAKGQARLTP